MVWNIQFSYLQEIIDRSRFYVGKFLKRSLDYLGAWQSQLEGGETREIRSQDIQAKKNLLRRTTKLSIKRRIKR